MKFLCGHYKSIADVCRRLEINRQQFNKYLGGQSAPSPYNLRKICDFFGVDEREIYEPHEVFVQIFTKLTPPEAGTPAPNFGLPGFFPDSTAELRKYLGYYYVYVVTPSRPGYVLKSISRIFEQDGIVKTKTFESIGNKTDKKNLSSVNKYNGFCFLSSQIIYIIEKEYLNNRGYIYTAMYPSFRNPVDLLNGLVLGMSGGNFRLPYSSQIVFERMEEAPDLRNAIAECGFLTADDESIPESVKARLLVPLSPTDFNMTAPIL